MNTMTGTTDRMRQALAWCDRRGVEPTSVDAAHGVAIWFQNCTSRAEFVATARAVGALEVDRHAGFLSASSDDVDGYLVHVHTDHSWTEGLDLDVLADELRAELNAVYLSDGVSA